MAPVPEPSTFLVFAGAALLLLVIPGPAVVYIVSQSIEHGRRAGLAAMLGIHAGTLVHITAAALGLSAILVSSAAAFTLVKILGACYLVYLGLRVLFGRERHGTAPIPREADLARIFRQGALVNVTNPKTALFFFAFLPQFVDPSNGAVGTQIAALGAVFMLLGMISDGLFGLLAGTAAGWVRARPGYSRLQRRVTGTIFIGLGVATALTGHRRT
jgi:threonine/homoserine/homoserine lactone efflux protein